MMNAMCKCGKFYVNEGAACPICGHVMTSTEVGAYWADVKARQKERKKENNRYRWGDKAAVKSGREEMRRREQERKEADKRPVSAVLIGTDSKKSGASTVGRALVGGALLGPIGAIAGAASGKSKTTKATFSVKYASGRTGTETVEIHSKRFKELSALLHS